MQFTEIRMDIGPKPIPEGAHDSEEKDLPVRSFTIILKNKYGLYEVYAVAEPQGEEQETWLHTYWNEELVGLMPSQVQFSTDGEDLYLHRNRGRRVVVSQESNRRVIMAEGETGLRFVHPVEGGSLLLTQAQRDRYQPDQILQNGNVYRTSPRQHLFVAAEVPVGVKQLYVVRFAPLILQRVAPPRNMFDHVQVYNPADLSPVRAGVFYGNGQTK